MGTHPIFESDFDCLTDKRNTRRCIEQTWSLAHPARGQMFIVPLAHPRGGQLEINNLHPHGGQLEVVGKVQLRQTSSGPSKTLPQPVVRRSLQQMRAFLKKQLRNVRRKSKKN